MPSKPILLTSHESHVSATNEVAYEISVPHYRERAEERYAGNDQWLKPIISTLGFSPGARAIDVGCAVGTNSLYLANQGYSVTGIDSSPRMISAARTAARNSGLDNRLRFVRQDFCTWVPVDEHLFDLVLATAFVHLFPAPLDRDSPTRCCPTWHPVARRSSRPPSSRSTPRRSGPSTTTTIQVPDLVSP